MDSNWSSEAFDGTIVISPAVVLSCSCSVVLHVVCKTVDVGVPEFLARFQIRGAFEDAQHFLGQFVALFLPGIVAKNGQPGCLS
jgi:hypothetical protein